MKFCTGCEALYPYSTEHFPSRRGKPTGAKCKKCCRERTAAYRARGCTPLPAKVHPETETCIRCGSEHPRTIEFFRSERGRVRSRVCASCTRAEAAVRARKSYHKNLERSRATLRRYYYRRPNALRSTKRLLKTRICVLVRKHLRKSKGRSKKIEVVLGYTVDDLKLHLEKQFLPGMSWQNFSEWQIDHITPARFFNFSSIDDAEFREFWALSNLRPLWSSDNASKGAKRTHLL
jgi:hypothetical protein